MNQIPNIEETEKILWCVERMLDGTYKSAEHKKLDILNYLKRTLTTHHHQLQKARESEKNSYRFDIEGKMYLAKELVKHIEHHDKLNASFERGRVNAFEEMLQTLDQAELDQDNKYKIN